MPGIQKFTNKMGKQLNLSKGYDITCEHCGKVLGTLPRNHGDFAPPSYGGIVFKKGLFSQIEYFCGDKCKGAWIENHEIISTRLAL